MEITKLPDYKIRCGYIYLPIETPCTQGPCIIRKIIIDWFEPDVRRTTLSYIQVPVKFHVSDKFIVAINVGDNHEG